MITYSNKGLNIDKHFTKTKIYLSAACRPGKNPGSACPVRKAGYFCLDFFSCLLTAGRQGFFFGSSQKRKGLNIFNRTTVINYTDDKHYTIGILI